MLSEAGASIISVPSQPPPTGRGCDLGVGGGKQCVWCALVLGFGVGKTDIQLWLQRFSWSRDLSFTQHLLSARHEIGTGKTKINKTQFLPLSFFFLCFNAEEYF